MPKKNTDALTQNLLGIVAPLLKWYDKHARILPWREDATPYRVWISEIMLQQTRVDAAKPFFERFLRELPNVASLASVPEDRLLKLWEGLGYYNRARNLQKAARAILADFGGELPRTRQELASLPGIGDYTAGAICSIAYGLPEPAVDGNVLRVVARLREDRTDITLPACKKEVTALLREIYPAQRCGDLTQSLMELGATVCVPNGPPKCAECPLAKRCLAHRNGTAEELPVKAKAKPRKVEERTVFLLFHQGKIAVCKRADTGLLAGMWQLPNTSGTLDAQAAEKQLKRWKAQAENVRPAGNAKHIFSHLEWHMTGYSADCAVAPDCFQWVSLKNLRAELSLPAAFTPFLRQLTD